MAMWRWEISLSVGKYFTSECLKLVKYFPTQKENLVSPSSRVMFCLLYEQQ